MQPDRVVFGDLIERRVPRVYAYVLLKAQLTMYEDSRGKKTKAASLPIRDRLGTDAKMRRWGSSEGKCGVRQAIPGDLPNGLPRSLGRRELGFGGLSGEVGTSGPRGGSSSSLQFHTGLTYTPVASLSPGRLSLGLRSRDTLPLIRETAAQTARYTSETADGADTPWPQGYVGPRGLSGPLGQR